MKRNSLAWYLAALLVCGVTLHLGYTQEVGKAAEQAGKWSKGVKGLQMRIELVEKPKYNGTRQLVPYMELKCNSRLLVRCDDGHVKFELVDSDGRAIPNRHGAVRSGPFAGPGTITIPHDSSIRINMTCGNWGVPKDAPAMIGTDSGMWQLDKDQKGRVYLRATIKGNVVDSDPHGIWHGNLEAFAKVDWIE